jgi:hypothetical protein
VKRHSMSRRYCGPRSTHKERQRRKRLDCYREPAGHAVDFPWRERKAAIARRAPKAYDTANTAHKELGRAAERNVVPPIEPMPRCYRMAAKAMAISGKLGCLLSQCRGQGSIPLCSIQVDPGSTSKGSSSLRGQNCRNHVKRAGIASFAMAPASTGNG